MSNLTVLELHDKMESVRYDKEHFEYFPNQDYMYFPSIPDYKAFMRIKDEGFTSHCKITPQEGNRELTRIHVVHQLLPQIQLK